MREWTWDKNGDYVSPDRHRISLSSNEIEVSYTGFEEHYEEQYVRISINAMIAFLEHHGLIKPQHIRTYNEQI